MNQCKLENGKLVMCEWLDFYSNHSETDIFEPDIQSQIIVGVKLRVSIMMSVGLNYCPFCGVKIK